MRTSTFVWLALLTLLASAEEALAATRTWTGGSAATNNWTDPANWGGTAPAAGDDLVFPPGAARKDTGVNNFAAGTSFVSLRINDAGYFVGGNALNLSAAQPIDVQIVTVAGFSEVRLNLVMTLTNPAATVRVQGLAGSPASRLQVNSITGSLRFSGTLTFNLASAPGVSVQSEWSTQLIETAPGSAIALIGGGILRPNPGTSFSGVASVLVGSLDVVAADALGTGDGTAATQTIVQDNGNITLRAPVVIANERLVMRESVAASRPALVGFGAGVSTWNGPILIDVSGTGTEGTFGTNTDNELRIGGAITGNGGIDVANIFTGAQTSRVTLVNPANAYTGTTALRPSAPGTVVLMLAAANVIPDTSGLTVASGSSRLDLGGFTESVGSFGGTGDLVMNNGTLRTGLNIAPSVGAYGGVLSGSGALVKTGNQAILRLSGNNTSSSDYTAEDGSLIVNGNQPGVDILLGGPSGIGEIAGEGTVGAISPNAGQPGRITPGPVFFPGILNSGSVTLGGNQLFRVYLNGATVGTQYSQLNVTGNVTLNAGATLIVFAQPPSLPQGTVLTLINNDGADPVTGIFASRPEGSVFMFGTRFVISYIGGDGNDVTLTRRDAAGVSINSVSQLEGNSGSSNLDFTVTRSDNASNFTVDFASANQTATAGSDYTATSGTLTFAAGGALTQTVSVAIAGDSTVEPDETFTVTLSNASGGTTLGTAVGIGTIVNDDLAATVAINDVSRAEGNAGTSPHVFTVTRSNAGSAFTVAYATSNGTATAGSDYTATNGTLTFSSGGALTQSISVPVQGDAINEPDETFIVTLSSITNGNTITDASGLGTIVNDDAGGLQISDATLTEGASGSTNAVFTVSRSDALAAFTVDVATANASAIAGSDYTATMTTLTFTAGGPLSQIVNVPVLGDSRLEPNETFTITLANLQTSSGAIAITDAQGIGTILNDDSVSVGIAGASGQEGNSQSSTLRFVVTLLGISDVPVTVQYATQNGSATAGDDYAASAGQLLFAPGQTSMNIDVVVFGDAVVEGDEVFSVVLSAQSPAAPAVTLAPASATGTIGNDDQVAAVPALGLAGTLALILAALGFGMLGVWRSQAGFA